MSVDRKTNRFSKGSSIMCWFWGACQISSKSDAGGQTGDSSVFENFGQKTLGHCDAKSESHMSSRKIDMVTKCAQAITQLLKLRDF